MRRERELEGSCGKFIASVAVAAGVNVGWSESGAERFGGSPVEYGLRSRYQWSGNSRPADC